jgi:hypothetical protein
MPTRKELVNTTNIAQSQRSSTQPPCSRCRRREAVIAQYAIDVVGLDERAQDLEAERDAYREALCSALDRLAAVTTALRHLRDRVAGLLLELRALRGRFSSRRAA